jgi:two-component sensor histidine kinase
MMEAASTRTAAKVSGRYRSAGNEYRMLETEVRPRFDASGTFLGFVGANIDVTERVRAEAHRDLLLSELNHRAKNTLAVVQGIAHQTFKRSSDAAESLQVFEGRLAALARAHDLLARGTEERASLYSLASEVLVGRVSDKTRANIEGPNIDLPPRLALSVSLTLHELFTNAIKYGALSNEAGKVELSWVVEAGKVNLVWRESGGPPVIPPSRKGFGSVLLVRTMEDVGGTVELNYRSEGLQCAVTIPINK